MTSSSSNLQSLPIVAIVGRPNVGKSALFNRFVGKRIAIVDKEAGVTRDRLYSTVEWTGKRFTLVDTGGLLFEDSDNLTRQIEKQAGIAIAEAQRILFLVDVHDGVTTLDREIAVILRPVRSKVILCVNKVDHRGLDDTVHEFHSLGYKPMFPLSAQHGLGIGELLDCVTESLIATQEESSDDKGIRVAVVGKPNVGKSSFVNALLKQERTIVSDVPGTTRDSIDTELIFKNKKLILIDTAGMKRKRRIQKAVEHFSFVRAQSSIERCDVVVLMLDGMSGITTGDLKIAEEIHEAGKSCLIVINKWDLLEGTSQNDFRLDVLDRLGFIQYSPVAFTSVLKGVNLEKSLQQVIRIYEQSQMKLRTTVLNAFLKKVMDKTPPPVVGTRPLKIYYVTQVGVAPAEFLAFVNDAGKMKESYRQFLINQLRKEFGFVGVPIVIRCKTSR